MNTPDIDIAMIGASGTGKTSLLASMYSQFTTAVPGAEQTNLVLEPDDSTRAWLGLRKTELTKIARQIVVDEQGIPGGADSRTLRLVLKRKDKPELKGHLALRFTDYPGGWLFPDSDLPTSLGVNNSELRGRMNGSQTLIVAIDTPALMFRDGKYHDQFNRPQEVADLVGSWARGQKRATLIMAPIKCERWMPDSRGLRDLAQAVRDGYPELRNVIVEDSRPEKVVITPVKTVGSLVHDHFELGKDGAITSRFRSATAQPHYSPEWTVEPLRQLLHQAVSDRLENRTFAEKFAAIFGRHRDLKQSVEDLSSRTLGPWEEF